MGGTYGGGRGQPGFAIPYGAMVPKKLDQLIGAGRCLDVDSPMVEDMRLIATCLLTGHAAGAAAALAVKDRCRPRHVDIKGVELTTPGDNGTGDNDWLLILECLGE
jgi:hypothetical protein